MNSERRPFPDGPQGARSFAVEDHAELAVLGLGPLGAQAMLDALVCH